jgi:hypothetical protein
MLEVAISASGLFVGDKIVERYEMYRRSRAEFCEELCGQRFESTRTYLVLRTRC